MRLQDSPSLEDFSGGLMTTPEPEKGRKGARFLMILLALIIAALLGVKLFQSDLPAQLAGRGTLSGQAVNEAGEPVPVEVLVFGTDILVPSDENGYFVVEGAPSGEQSVIVAYGSIAAEIELTVQPGVDNALGTVTVPTELLELVDE